MAVCFQGLDFNETLSLTKAMSASGKIYDWDSDGLPVVDKHSTGGVGDTVTLSLAPLVASMGMRMGKHSGRGLGHTGGTIDKLESIPGFQTSLDESRFREIVNSVGCAVAGQDKSMTPADGILYSLRDVTDTVNQESLIAASIMSKKLAGGAPNILLDVKVGAGAFMKDIESARSLADLMKKLGAESGRNVAAELTSMSQPLGRAIGNALEVKEAICVLKGESDPADPLRHICIEFASRLASMAGLKSIRDARNLARENLQNGSALERFGKMIEAQGGESSVIENPNEVLPAAGSIIMVDSKTSGFIADCDALILGEIVRDLGAGRKSRTDEIDLSVGIVISKRVGDRISSSEPLCEIHSNGGIDDRELIDRALSAFVIAESPPEPTGIFLT